MEKVVSWVVEDGTRSNPMLGNEPSSTYQLDTAHTRMPPWANRRVDRRVPLFCFRCLQWSFNRDIWNWIAFERYQKHELWYQDCTWLMIAPFFRFFLNLVRFFWIFTRFNVDSFCRQHFTKPNRMSQFSIDYFDESTKIRSKYNIIQYLYSLVYELYCPQIIISFISRECQRNFPATTTILDIDLYRWWTCILLALRRLSNLDRQQGFSGFSIWSQNFYPSLVLGFLSRTKGRTL